MQKFIKKRLGNTIKKDNSGGYFLNAIKEISMLVIGILIALFINNWNAERKNRHVEREIYKDFLTALTKDSIHLTTISNTFSDGFQAQKYFIQNSSDKVLKEKSLDEIQELALKTLDVSHSFFPRYGIYQEVLNNGEFTLLKSDDIRNQLTEIYERRYKLYEHVDATVEQKIHFELQPIVKGKYQLFLPEEKVISPQPFNSKIFKEHYSDFTYQLRSMNSILGSTEKIIGVMGENIHIALQLLRDELGTGTKK